MKANSKFAACLLAAVVLVGCTRPIANFGLIAPGDVADYGTIEMQQAPSRDVEADDGRFWFLFIPFDNAPDLDEAVARALDDVDGDYIKNVRIYSTAWTLLLFSYDSYSVRGSVGSPRPPMTVREERVIVR